MARPRLRRPGLRSLLFTSHALVAALALAVVGLGAGAAIQREFSFYLAHLARAVRHGSGGIARGQVRVGAVVARHLMERLRRIVLAAVAVAGLLSLGLAVALGSLLARPLRRMTAAARAIAAGRHGGPLGSGGSRETVELATAISELDAQLARAAATEQRLLREVVHELATPLSALRGYVEGIGDGVFAADAATLRAVLGEIDRLGRLVDRLGGAMDAAAVHRRQPLGAEALLEPVLAPQQAAAGAKGVTLQWSADPGVLWVDPDLLRQVVVNLVDNAVRCTPPGGLVRVAARRQGSAWSVCVEDSGPGVPPQDREGLLGPPPDGGAGRRGIGLYVSRRIVQGHGGSLRLEDSELGGARCVIELPAAAGRLPDGA